MSITAAEPTARGDSAPNIAAEYNGNVPLDVIERDPANRIPSEGAVTAMANAIESEGLLQPVVLRSLGGGKYRLIAGEHRWRAFKKLKRETIPALIRKSENDLSSARKALVENLARENLTAIERARRFKQLEDLKMTQKEIGQLAGLSQPVVANALRLLDLPPGVQEMIAAGKLSEAHGVSLARFAKWPKACSSIAKMAESHGYGAKELNQQAIPFSGQLEQEQLLERIRVKPAYWDEDAPVYSLPRHLGSHRDFVSIGNEGDYVYYFTPADPKDNVWAAEKAKQDEERKALAAAKEKREAGKIAKQGGMTDEQRERKKTLEKNKQQRAENAAGLKAAIDKLKLTYEPTALLVAILAEKAIAGGFGAKRVFEAAELVGVKLPSGAVSSNGGQGLHSVDALAKMDAGDLARFAVAVLIVKDVDDANRNAWSLPKNVVRVKDSVVPPANLGPGDVVEWVSGGKTKRGTILTEADFNKDGRGGKWSSPNEYAPVRLNNPEGYDLPLNGVRKMGLTIVKSATPAERNKAPLAAPASRAPAPVRRPPGAMPKVSKAKKKGGRAVIDDQVYSDVRLLAGAGFDGAQIAKAIGISMPSVQACKKRLGLIPAGGRK